MFLGLPGFGLSLSIKPKPQSVNYTPLLGTLGVRMPLGLGGL